ncbi:hypothetical protein FACS189472_11860 [Alphaproteobacteria bacterium]|nr:hypothetical protein FACS189472_11860 [Alphaproteobacteria bacterium]
MHVVQPHLAYNAKGGEVISACGATTIRSHWAIENSLHWRGDNS